MPLKSNNSNTLGFNRKYVIFTGLVVLLVVNNFIWKQGLLLIGNDTKSNNNDTIVYHVIDKTVKEEERQEQDDGDNSTDGCGLVNDSKSTRWRNYQESDHQDWRRVQQCIPILLKRVDRPRVLQTVNDINAGVLPTPNSNINNKRNNNNNNNTTTTTTTYKKLDCNVDVDLKTLQNTLKQYKVIWFIGDSLMEQQFYSLICMMDPSLGNDTNAPFKITHDREELVWKHSSKWFFRDDDRTVLRYSRFGYKWETNEYRLYRDDFPTAIRTLGKNDAIVLNAGYHYDSTRIDLFEKAVRFITKLSTKTKASVFFMEPSLEEWPTSNGIWTKACMWRCECEFLDPLRILGRGNYTQPTDSLALDMSQKPPTPPVSNVMLQRLYPDLAFANRTGDCIPDCLPATWRMDIARALILEQTSEHKKHNAVEMIPVFWQIHAKGSPSGKGTNEYNVGDCTHKSLDAILLMNEQMVRSMMQMQRKAANY